MEFKTGNELYNSDQVNLEQVRAEYLDNAITEPPVTLYRIDDRGLRMYYSLDGKFNPTFYGSSTTIKSLVTPTPRAIIDKEIRMGSEAFRAYRDNRASFGTFWHIMASVLTREGEFNLGNLQDNIERWASMESISDTEGWHEDAWKGLMSWMQTMNDYEIIPLAIEVPLAHPEGFAGTIDLVCEMNAAKYTEKTPPENRNRIIAIIDWKTGYIYPDHAIQLFINKRIWEHNFPNKAIDRVYNWTWRDWKTKPSYDLRNQTDSEEAGLIKHYIDIWKTKFYNKPRTIKTANGVLSIGESVSGLWQEKTIEQYVREKHEKLAEIS